MPHADTDRVEDRFGAVRRVSLALRRAGVEHALGGSALRWSLGLERRVRDWDLTTDADESVVRAALAPFAPEFAPPRPPFESAFLCRLRLDGETVEVIGRFAIATPTGTVRIATRVGAWAHGVPWAHPGDWERAYRALGRGEQAASLAPYAADIYPTTLAAPAESASGEAPDLLRWPDGRSVATAAEWRDRSAAWRELVTRALYGPVPPGPERLEVALGAHARVARLQGGPTLTGYRLRAVVNGAIVPLGVQVLRPAAAGRRPLVIDGDAGWWPPSDEAVTALLERGVALARLDRTEVAFDDQATPDGRPRGPLPDALQAGDTGALAHWAWALQRALDLVQTLDWVDPERLALSGFSRGGKAALLAGAWDERARVVHAHASGAGGAASSRLVPDGAERLADVVARFPTWFAPGASLLATDPSALPFDQHALIAAIAPRTVVLTCGLGDAWANPIGTAHAVAAARPAFTRLGADDALVWRVRPGGHALEAADLVVLAETLLAS